jgi:sortase A
MKHIKQNSDPDYQPISAHRLQEGEEVNLTIPKHYPASENSAAAKTSPQVSSSGSTHQSTHPKQDRIASHASGDFNGHLRQHNQPTVQTPPQPRINLHPDAHKVISASTAKASKKQAALNKMKSIRSHKHWHNAKLVVGTVLVFLLVFNSQWFISQLMYLFNKPSSKTTQDVAITQPAAAPAAAEVVGPANEIIIPKIGVTAPLVFPKTNVETEVLLALRGGVAHYYGTAYPGENGNSVFFGHSSGDWWEAGNYKFIFVILEKLSIGDTYEIHYNSRKYIYQVEETKVVAPSDLSVLNQTSYPSSTLITCTPPGTSWQRFVVRAKQIAPAYQKPAVPKTAVAPVATDGQATLPSASKSIWEQFTSFLSGLFGVSKNEQTKSNQPTQIKYLPEVN